MRGFSNTSDIGDGGIDGVVDGTKACERPSLQMVEKCWVI